MWDAFFESVSRNQSSIILVCIVLVLIVVLMQWICWIFGWGRFSVSATTPPPPRADLRGPLRHVIADLFVKVIDDFRHLLALLIVIVFAVSLFYSLATYGQGVDNLSKALQAVTGSLGGIIGVILGYYFGESAARPADAASRGKGTVGDPKQEPPPQAAPPAADAAGAPPLAAAPRPAAG
jgi:hypothetical protein